MERTEDGSEELSSGCAVYPAPRPFRMGSFLIDVWLGDDFKAGLRVYVYAVGIEDFNGP
jgi:hypothetical protein